MELLNLTALERDGASYNKTIVVKVSSIVRAIAIDGRGDSLVYVHEYIDNDEVTPYITEFRVSESPSDIASQVVGIVELSVEEYSNTDVSASPVTRAIPLHLMREIMKEEKGTNRTQVTIHEDRDEEITYTVSEDISTVWSLIQSGGYLTGSNLTSPFVPYYDGSVLQDSLFEYDSANTRMTQSSGEFRQTGTGIYTSALTVEANTILLLQETGDYTVQWENPADDRTLQINDPGDDDAFVFASAAQTLSSKTLDAPTISNPPLTLEQNTANYSLGWDDPAAARVLTIPDPGADDRFVFASAVQTLSSKTIDAATISTSLSINDGVAVSLGTTNGVQFGSSSSELIGFLGATPVAQQSSSGITAGFTQGSGTGVNNDSTFTGNNGTEAYTIGDLVDILKTYGFLVS
jgi:hypothetical protein